MTEFDTIEKHLSKVIPRLMTQLCRDEDNPLFGCFDRDFWHYKIRDFPSMVLHQPVAVLDMISKGDLKLKKIKISKEKADIWINACLSFWVKSQKKNGSFDEYYPNESGFPPTAFSLYSTALICKNRHIEKETLSAMEKAASFILKKSETEALNQEIVGLTACSLVKKLGGAIEIKKLQDRWNNLFARQSSEGWFNEYDGADTGYLSVSCDALYDYYGTEKDRRALTAITKATDYIYNFMAVDDSIPAMVNSRNTNYVLIYGLARFGQNCKFASSIVKRLIHGIDNPCHYLHATDDRYLSHYIYTSWFRALPYLKNLTTDKPVPSKGKWFKEAGILALHEHGNYSIHVAAGKGGVIIKTKQNGTNDKNLGWRAILKENLLTCTHWQEPLAKFSLIQDNDCYQIKTIMPLKKHRFLVPSPINHFLLRILSLFFGRKIIPYLKKLFIFSNTKINGSFEREITIVDSKITISDAFNCSKKIIWKKADWSSLRHVSSAGSFCFCEGDSNSDLNSEIE